MEKTLCKNCNRIYTSNELCIHCQNVSPEKMYPSKIATVYPEGSLHQNLAVFAFNHLAESIDKKPILAVHLANDFSVTEDEVYAALEDLYTEN